MTLIRQVWAKYVYTLCGILRNKGCFHPHPSASWFTKVGGTILKRLLLWMAETCITHQVQRSTWELSPRQDVDVLRGRPGQSWLTVLWTTARALLYIVTLALELHLTTGQPGTGSLLMNPVLQNKAIVLRSSPVCPDELNEGRKERQGDTGALLESRAIKNNEQSFTSFFLLTFCKGQPGTLFFSTVSTFIISVSRWLKLFHNMLHNTQNHPGKHSGPFPFPLLLRAS